MSLQLREGVHADLDRLMDIQFQAFGPDPLDQTFFPNGVSPDTRARMTEYARRDMLDNLHATFMTVIDLERDNEIIAFGKWYIYKHDRTESEWNNLDSREWGEDTNREAVKAFFTTLGEKRRKYMAGKPRCLLGVLGTHSHHQQRGAGAMLVQWGADVADEAGSCCYLDASAAGYRLYRKKRFEDVDVIEMDLSRFGGKGHSRHICVIRPVKAAGFQT